MDAVSASFVDTERAQRPSHTMPAQRAGTPRRVKWPAPPPLVKRAVGRREAVRLASLDLVVVVACLGGAYASDGLGNATVGMLQFLLLVVPVWMSAMVLGRAYDVRRLGASSDEFWAIARASITTGLTVSAAAYLLDLLLPRDALLIGMALVTGTVAAERYLVRRWLRRKRARGELCHRAVLVGSAQEVMVLGDALNDAPHLGYSVVGCTLTGPATTHSAPLPAPAFGSPHKLAVTCAWLGADTVFLAGDAVEIRRLTWDLEGAGVQLIVIPRLDGVSTARLRLRAVAGLPMLHVEEPRGFRCRQWPKRVFDVAVSLVALVLLLPLMSIVAAAIKVHDGGPVLFWQDRVGLGGGTFRMWKFRSMSIDAATLDAEIRKQHHYASGLFKLVEDPRVTRIGRVLRRFSIDELPQLFNVLGGSMSLVGPRPFVQVEVDTFADEADRRLHVRPGMTGLWQVSGRSRLSAAEAVQLDLYYRDNWSMVTDLHIMAKTVKAVVGSDGAY